MAISVSVPKEITEYRSKMFFGLSGRQLGYLVAGCAVGAAVAGIGYGLLHISMDIVGYAVMVAAMPLVALGFIRPHNMPLEQYAKLLYRHIAGQNLLPYQTELVLDTFQRQRKGRINNVDLADVALGTYKHHHHQQGRNRVHQRKKRSRRYRHSEECQSPKTGGKAYRRSRQAKAATAKNKIKAARKEVRTIRREKEKAA